MHKILGQGDYFRQPAGKPQRELSFYGSIRKGFEDALQGLEAVEKVCSDLSKSNPDNVRLERYCLKLEAISNAVYKLYLKAGRIKVQGE